MISRGLLEAMREKKLGKAGEPLSTCLFKPIQGMSKAANLARIINNETRRKLHVHFLIELSMKESIINIKLMQMPSMESSESK